MMPASLFYWVGFLVYAAIAVAIGLYARRRKKPSTAIEAADFWTASHSLSGWSAGLSISASMMSISWSCVYGVQLFYWYGLGALWLLAIPWLLAMAGFFLLAPRLRRIPAFSQPEMVGSRFGARARQFLALPLAFVYLVWCGAEIYAAGQILSPLLNTSPQVMYFLIALTVATYSYLGGFAAVVSTDKFQFVLVAFFIACIALLGGTEVMQRTTLTEWLASTPHPPKAQTPALSLLSPGIPLIIMTFVAYLPGWLVTTDVWIRLQAARSDREARKGAVIAAANSFVFVTLAPMIIGLAALYLYPPDGSAIPERLKDGAAIFAVVMQDFGAIELNVLLATGLAAASMSTIDTTGNVMALSISYDILEPLLAGRSLSRLKASLPRYASVGAIIAAFIYALLTESLWDIFYLSSGVLTTAVFIPMAALFMPGAKPRQVQAAILAGFSATIVFYFLESRGILGAFEPKWMAETGLGYLLWGFVIAGVAFVLGGGRKH